MTLQRWSCKGTQCANHYVALINANSTPPIDIEGFRLLQNYTPETLADVEAYIRAHPQIKVDTVHDVYYHFHHVMDRELEERRMNGSSIDRGMEYRLEDYLFDLIYALYWKTNVEGFMITADLSLNSGKLYFPPGTSAGWENPIADTEVVFVLPSDRKFVSPVPGRGAYLAVTSEIFFDMYSTRQLVAGMFLFFYGFYLLVSVWWFWHCFRQSRAQLGADEAEARKGHDADGETGHVGAEL